MGSHQRPAHCRLHEAWETSAVLLPIPYLLVPGLCFARLVAVPPPPPPPPPHPPAANLSRLWVFGTDQSEHDVCPSDHSANVSHLDWGCISARSDWSLSRASTRHPAHWRAASASQHRSLETAATLPPRYMLTWLHSCNLIVLRLTALALIHYLLASAAQYRQAATNRSTASIHIPLSPQVSCIAAVFVSPALMQMGCEALTDQPELDAQRPQMLPDLFVFPWRPICALPIASDPPRTRTICTPQLPAAVYIPRACAMEAV